jgi:AraC-like DNA-binding protein
MIYPAEADIIPLVRGVVSALDPYARANLITLSFEADQEQLIIQYHPCDLLQSLSHLVCQVINFIPDKSEIIVRIKHETARKEAILEVQNSGICLVQVTQININNGCRHQFEVCSLNNGTLYQLILPMQQTYVSTVNVAETRISAGSIPKFYSEVRKRLCFSFTQSEKLVAALSHSRPLEAVFLQKINALIIANLGNENFDTMFLSRAMAMSRTQLFRRLKPLIRQAPALYIRTMRLQKAKELLETTDLSVGEVAFKTGFPTQSNFTKVFVQHYSVLPSVFRRNSKLATNE